MKNDSYKSQELRKYKLNKVSAYLLGFYEGISMVSLLAINYFFKDKLKVEPSALTSILATINLPVILKALFGFLSDSLPICGYKRKIYIIICSIINMISWIIFMIFVKSVLHGMFWLLVSNSSVCFLSVLCQAILVELNNTKDNLNLNYSQTSNDLVSVYSFCKYFGVFLSSFLNGFIIQKLGLKAVFFLSALLCIIPLTSGIILREKIFIKNQKDYMKIDQNVVRESDSKIAYEDSDKNDDSNIRAIPIPIIINSNNKMSIKNLFKKFIMFFCDKYVLVPTIFIIFLLSIPNFKDTLFYYESEQLHFVPKNFSTISIFNNLMILVGILTYKIFLSKISFKNIILVIHSITIFAYFLLYLCTIRINKKMRISDLTFVTFVTSLYSATSNITIMPMMALACSLCPKNLEGSIYAVFMSAINLGDLLSGYFGGLLTEIFRIKNNNFKNFDEFVLTCCIFEIIPLIVLVIIPNYYFTIETESTKIEVKEVKIDISDSKNKENKWKIESKLTTTGTGFSKISMEDKGHNENENSKINEEK